MIKLLVVLFAFISLSVVASENSSSKYQLTINGMSCPFCAYGVEKNLLKIKAIAKIDVNLKGGIVIIQVKKGQSINRKEIEKAVKRSGFYLKKYTKIQ
jgi:copper chaperone CopZ